MVDFLVSKAHGDVSSDGAIEEEYLLWDIADGPSPSKETSAFDRFTIHDQAPRGGPKEAENKIDEGCLSGARRADKPNGLASVHDEVDVSERFRGALRVHEREGLEAKVILEWEGLDVGIHWIGRQLIGEVGNHHLGGPAAC